MTRLSVWAPAAETVQLVICTPDDESNEAFDMTKLPAPAGAELDVRGDGWWEIELEKRSDQADDGLIDYGFILKSPGGTQGTLENPLPDPRSRRQPAGVHGASRNWAASSYSWKDQEWRNPGLTGGAVYELHVGTFTPEGTLDSAADKIGYLKELGVAFVELLPVNSFNGTHNWGYDGVAWFAVQETYGGPDAYQRFVDEAHAHGIGVIQDVVYNHLGPSGNYLPQFGPYLKRGDANTWGDSLNLDGPDSDEVRRYIVDNVGMWLKDFHVDGLRLDAVHALRDDRAVHILEEIAVAVSALEDEHGPKFLIAESDLNNDRLIRPRLLGGYGLSAQWDDDYHHAIHANITGELEGYYADFGGVAALAKTLTQGFFHDGSWSSFRERHHGRPIDKNRVRPSQLVVCIQDHDQIGNRAAGDRWSPALGADKLILGAALNILSPFTPMLFMGEEFAASTPWQFFTGHPEPELGAAVQAGRFAEFEKMGWDRAQVPDPQDPQTFANSKLMWDEASAPANSDHAVVLRAYREMLALRRTTPQLTTDSFASVGVDFSEADEWLLLNRADVTVLFNMSEQSLELTRLGNVEKFATLLWSSPNCAGRTQDAVPGISVTVWKAKS